jgi:hypothetical protein
VVRWAASDSDGDALMASVAYSLDDGRHWRTIFSGPDAGSAVLPGAYFSASKHGRVAVRVNDGFDEAAAVSQRFRALGAAPVVRLLSPAAGARILNTSTLVLSGQAIDDAGKILTGRRLQWFAGARRLGRGASLSTADLAPGKQRIRLVAMDRTGRRGSATVLVTVAATVPQLLSLDGPKKVARKARSVTLKLAVSARSNLAVNGRRFTVGQRPKAVRIPIRRGAGVLKLRLVLRAGGKSTVLKIRLPRG